MISCVRLTLLASLALASVAAAAPAAPAATPDPAAPVPAAPIVIANFTEMLPNVYGYGTWQNAFAVAPKAGFRVLATKGAQGDGGFCQNLQPALDLAACTYIELALAVQPDNQVPEYTITFSDGDGTQCWGRVRVAQLAPGYPVWLRLKRSDFAVSTRDPGKDGKMDWAKVAQWHLQGDWQTKQPAQVLFIALRGRP
ncbi:hypothetical protein [Opitutus sp. ER46]|uniref:hypothetical protein n=1 Tax=Opitutus sp. ER46 TaxID=2161864 RepID=UPI000D31F9DF|nr:hypothetical protein [Opitutus sp. ER46]PTX96537.1 hypothetical protein DB354_07725 [Opitutus sp. ER46]